MHPLSPPLTNHHHSPPNTHTHTHTQNKKGSLDEIAEYIKKRGPRASGIVYCLSRRDTERLAESLSQKTGMKVSVCVCVCVRVC
jgi:superfamily II DNA helicase RecQ